MAEISNTVLAVLVVAALVVVVAGTVLNLNGGVTGFVTQDTGNVTLSVNNTLAIQVNSSYGVINFGYCSPRPGSSYWCASNDSLRCDGTVNNNCTGDGASAQYIQVDNVGNVDANITVKANCIASGLIGGTAPAFTYMTNNCNGTAVSSWTSFAAADTYYSACSNITVASKGPGRMKFYVNVTIPQDASPTGCSGTANTSVLTFNAVTSTG